MSSKKDIGCAELVTINQGCALMNCCRATAYKRVHDGEILAFRVGERLMLCPESIRVFMRAQPVIPHSAAA